MKKGHLRVRNLDHCIDPLRQNLMCFDDITPMPYQWKQDRGIMPPATAMMQTCRDLDALRKWAFENRAAPINASAHLYDPLDDSP